MYHCPENHPKPLNSYYLIFKLQNMSKKRGSHLPLTHKLILIWVLMNLMMLPLATFADTDQKTTKKISKTTTTKGIFSSVTPLPNTNQNNNPSASSSFSLFLLIGYYLALTLGATLVFYSKKAQLTLFLLFGIIILFIFGFLIYYRANFLQSETSQAAKKSITNFLETSSFQGFVQSCLDKALVKGLDLIGKQGGFIYDHQGGVHRYRGPPQPGSPCVGLRVNCDYSENVIPVIYSGDPTVYNITYAIKSKHPAGYSRPPFEPPGYPYSKRGFQNESIKYFGVRAPNLFGYLDLNETIPYLCSEEVTHLNSSLLINISFLCEFNGDHSVEETLEKFLNKTINDCANFSKFINQSGYKVNATFNKTSVIIGEEDVTAVVDADIQTITGEDIKFNSFTFISRQPVRLKFLYELAFHALSRDVQDVLYQIGVDEEKLNKSCKNYRFFRGNLTRDLPTVPCQKSGMGADIFSPRVVIDETSCNDGTSLAQKNHCTNATMLELSDSKSKLSGNPYYFYVAIENRPPVLDYIDESVNNSFIYFFHVQSNSRMFGSTEIPISFYSDGSTKKDNINIINAEGSNIIFLPRAIDPDEDRNLKYTYQGWKTPNVIEQFGSLPNYEISNNRGVFLSTDTIAGTLGPNTWEESSPFSSEFGAAQNLTRARDVGYHIVRVTVEDSGGLKDYQDVRIQVRCDIDYDFGGGNILTCGDAGTDYHFT